VIALLLFGGGVIGFLLAVLGAGGSILLLPILVTGAGLSTRDAVPLSLVVVTLLAIANMIPYLRRRCVAPRPALLLGVPALVGAWIGGTMVKAGWIAEPVQLALFAIAALLAALLMLSRQKRSEQSDEEPAAAATVRAPALMVQGVLVGLLTGIAGVGGGFAIVPALVLLAGLPMQLASGTSLVLIGLNSLVALAALGHWPADRLPLVIPLLIGGAVGGLVGQALAPHLKDRQLRIGFAVLLVSAALLTGWEGLRRQRTPVKRMDHLSVVMGSLSSDCDRSTRC
jgi:uncharacterized membrane protein YfcA